MNKNFLAVAIFCIVFSSCRKIEYGLGLISPKYDVGFYMPDLRNFAAYYVSVDGGQITELPTPIASSINCSTPGILHYSLSMGTHTVVISAGGINGNSYTLILSKSGATLDGKPLQLQSCNNDLSVVISSMGR